MCRTVIKPRVELVDDALEADDGEQPGAEAGQPGQEEDSEGQEGLPAGRVRHQAPRFQCRSLRHLTTANGRDGYGDAIYNLSVYFGQLPG